MLFRIVIALAFFVFSLNADLNNFAEISQKCEEENGLTSGEIQLINATKPMKTDDVKVKCYFRCLLLEFNLMNSEGELIPDGLAGIKPEFGKYVTSCINTTGVDTCDKALNFENCVWEKKLADEGQ